MRSRNGLTLILAALCLAAGAGYCQYVEDSIDVGGWNQSGLVYNSRAGVVYGRCYYGDNFFAIACSTNELVAQIPLMGPIATAYASTVNKAYCTFSYHGGDSVLVVDGSTHQRIKAVRIDGAYLPVWDSVSNRLYISCFDYDEIAVFDCGTDSVLERIPIPGEPVKMAINTKRRKLYVQNDYDMTVSVIDMNTNQVIRNVYVGSWFFCAAYSEVADKYYCNGTQGVAVICGAGDTLIRQIRLPQGYLAKAMVSVEPESLVMVATYSGGADSVFMLDVGRNEVRSAIRVGSSPKALVYSMATHLVYCANSGWDNLSVIAEDGSKVLSQVAVGDGPMALCVCSGEEKLYVGHGGMTNMVYAVCDRLGVAEEAGSFAEIGYERWRAAPSPFSSQVWLERVGKGRAPAAVSVYSQDGRFVRGLAEGQGGRYVWNGRDTRERRVAPGVYFAVVTGSQLERVRLVKAE